MGLESGEGALEMAAAQDVSNKVVAIRSGSERWMENVSSLTTRSGSERWTEGFSNHSESLERTEQSEPVTYTPQLRRREMTRRKLSSLSVTKLDFFRVGLHGRDKETQLLEAILSEVCDSTTGNDRGLVAIEGFKGTGKTALAAHLKKPVRAMRGFYTSGKFDMLIRDPLSAIKTAVVHLFDQILDLNSTGSQFGRNDPALYNDIKRKIIEELISEIPLLERVIPNLVEMVGHEAITSNSKDGFKEANDHFIFALRKFIQIITSFAPVVMVCDDMQWADSESISLLKTWITDVSTKSLIIIGCYRRDTVDENHVVSKLFDEAMACRVDRSISVEKIVIEDLKFDDANSLFTEILSADDGGTQTLAETAMKKTGGNVFAIQHFLLSLMKQELLAYNVGLTKWIWDDEAIKTRSIATENVANLMTERLKEVEVARRILPLAACLGTTFSLETMNRLMEDANMIDTIIDKLPLLDQSKDFIASTFLRKSSDLVGEIQQCVEDGFIEDVGGGKFSFVHNNVKEASLSLIDDGDLIKFRIGERLWRSSNKSELDDILFVVVGLLGRRLDLIPDRAKTKLEIARLYHLAGQKAMSISSFRSSAGYFKVAIGLLPPSTWEIDRLLCLDLYSSATECAYGIGNFEDAKVYANKIILQKCSPLDKLRVYLVLLDAYVAEEQDKFAVKLGIDILSQMGVHFPKHKGAILFKTIRGLLSTKKSVKNITPEFIDNLPVTTDPTHIGVMKMLDAFMNPCYCGKKELMALVCIAMNKHTFKEGITPYAPVSFMFFGFILSHFLNDFEGGKVYADHAVALLRKYNYKRVEPKTLFMLHSAVWHWTNPLQSSMQTFVDIYVKGMRVGDTETAMVSIYYYLDVALYTGRNLNSIETDLVIYMNQMVDYKQQKVLRFSEFLLQSIRNLQGKSANTVILSGSVVDQEKSLEKYEKAKDELMLGHIHQRRMFLACYFGDYELCADVALERGDRTLKAIMAQTCVPVLTFCCALSCFIQSRQKSKKQKQYKKQATLYRRQIEKWSTHNPNVVHYLQILDAEKAVSAGKTALAVENFEKAIVTSGRAGLLQDQALANERLAEVFFEANLPNEGKYRLGKAIELYSEWNARPISRRLQRRMDNLPESFDEEPVGSNSKGSPVQRAEQFFADCCSRG